MAIRSVLCLSFFLCLYMYSARAANCDGTSVGFTPIIDMTVEETYQGFTGRLYQASNNVPPAHAASGMIMAGNIQPLDASGNPSPSGKIGFTSIGMSNTNQEFAQLISDTDADPLKRPEVVLMNGAQGGQPAEKMIDITAAFWTDNIPSKLTGAGLTAEQVQVAWLKQTNASPNGPFPSWAINLKDQLIIIMQHMKTIFPNLQITYISPRIYAGYADTLLNPEPYAYESAYSIKWAVNDQITGMSNLNFNASAGPVKTSFVCWGPYIWADGTTPNSEGLFWTCPDDFKDDGTHPANPEGRIKVADKLMDMLHDDPSAFWYRTGAPPPGTTGTPSSPPPPPAGTTGSQGGDQCYGYGADGGACLGDCDCGGCGGDGCMPGDCVGPTRPEDAGKCSGNWNHGSSCPCGGTTGVPPPPSTTGVPAPSTTGFPPPPSTTGVPAPSTTGVPPPPSTTGVPPPPSTTGAGQTACSTFNGNPSGCRGSCWCGYCSPLGCTEGDASGPDSGTCNNPSSWQFFGPC